MPKEVTKKTQSKSRKKKVAKLAKKKIKKKKTFHNFVFKSHFKPSRRIGQGGVLKKSPALGRLIKWPKYVQLQRQKKILLQRLTIPPALHLFSNACSKDFASKLVRFLRNYRPETSKEKRDRLRSWAKLQSEGKPVPAEKPILIRYGFNTVTNLIEAGRAKFVIIAHDVDPIELVLWMPTLCVKKDIPFIIFKSKARLGTLVNKKTASCLCLTDVKPSHAKDLANIQRDARKKFNGRFNILKKMYGKRILGIKTVHKTAKRKRAAKAERLRRAAALK